MNATEHAEAYAEVQSDITRLEGEVAELRAVAKWHYTKANGSYPNLHKMGGIRRQEFGYPAHIPT